jgi:acetolactate synthase-1/2/3 large subunit
MYMPQTMWTMAREKLDVTMVVFANRSYAILRNELFNVGASNPGPRAMDMMEIGRPDIDWVGLANSLGVPGSKVRNMEEFNSGLRDGIAEKGPFLLEVVL